MAVFVSLALLVLAWSFARRSVPDRLLRMMMRVGLTCLLIATPIVALRSVDADASAVLVVSWLLLGGLSFWIRRRIASAKDREAHRAALDAARTRVRRRAPPPPPLTPGSP